MVDDSDLAYAREQLAEADKRLRFVEERIDTGTDESSLRGFETFVNIPNIISDCQVIIETSTKSMFKMVGVEHPNKHQLEFEDDRVEGFLREIPGDFKRKSELPRALFLTKFWHQFYTESKYGVPSLNINPRDLFNIDDAIRASDDAEFIVGLADDLLQAVGGRGIHEELDMELDEFVSVDDEEG